jgi:hypothetical protein
MTDKGEDGRTEDGVRIGGGRRGGGGGNEE